MTERLSFGFVREKTEENDLRTVVHIACYDVVGNKTLVRFRYILIHNVSDRNLRHIKELRILVNYDLASLLQLFRVVNSYQ